MRARVPRAMDEPIRPRPMTVTREKGGISVPLPSSSCRAHQFAQRLRHAAGLVLGADRGAQTVGEPLAGQPADDIALFHQPLIGPLEIVSSSCRDNVCQYV